MLTTLTEMIEGLTITPEMVILAGIGFGVLIVIYGLSAAMAGDTAATQRMHRGTIHRPHGADFDLIRGDSSDPHGLLKAFVPTSQKERSKIARMLRQAGIQSNHAVRTFYTFRTIAGIVLPLLFIVALALPTEVKQQLEIAGLMQNVSWVQALQIVTVLVVVGFYGPWMWLRSRIRTRRQKIEYSLPNALDLMQVAIEAGLGFDAAMVRVSHELAEAAPEISQEFMMLQLEVQAGKEREAAFFDMAQRAGVEELSSFANAILQSNQFGSSLSTTLNRFAIDMRQNRELKAQAKANRLPVQMSVVMAACMMPVLLLICLAPMMIRWVNMFP